MLEKKVHIQRFSRVLVVVCLLIGSVMFFRANNAKLIADEKERIGLELVNAMYDFRDAYQLDSNMVKLKELVTEPVFNDLTIDNEQRTLTTYLKFKNETSTVVVQKSTSDYVIYSLDTEYVDTNRVFVLFFDVDKEGKVCWYKEVEGIEFINTIY